MLLGAVSLVVLWLAATAWLIRSEGRHWLRYNISGDPDAEQAEIGVYWQAAVRRYWWGETCSADFGIRHVEPDSGFDPPFPHVADGAGIEAIRRSGLARPWIEQTAVGVPWPVFINRRFTDLKGDNVWREQRVVLWWNAAASVGLMATIGGVVGVGLYGVIRLIAGYWRLERGECPSCRYDLTGAPISTTGRCPECGARIVTAPDRRGVL